MNGNGQSDPWSVADAADPSSSSSSSSNKQPVVTYNIQESIEELGRLAETAGLKVSYTVDHAVTDRFDTALVPGLAACQTCSLVNGPDV